MAAEWWRQAPAGRRAQVGSASAPPADSVVPFTAFLVFACVLLLAPQAVLPGLGHMPIALLTGAFAILAHCWTRFAAGRPLMRWTRETWLVGALLVWAIFTLPLSLSPSRSLRILVGYYLKSVGVFWLVSNTVTTVGRLRTAAWGLSLASAPLAATGVWSYFSHHLHRDRIVSYDAPMTADPNSLALTLNLILPLTVALFVISRRPAIRALLVGLILLDASAIIVTFSRAGFLALATIFVLYLAAFVKWREWTWVVAALALLVATVPLLPPGYMQRLSTITDINSDITLSAQLRAEDYRAGLTYALNHPLIGDGLGGSPLGLMEVHVERGEPAFYMVVHNVYLAYAMDLGWLGLGLFLLLLLSCIGTAVRVRERCAGVPALWDLSVLAEGIRIMLVGFAVAALFVPQAYEVYFYFFAALAVAADTVDEAVAHRAADASLTSAPQAIVARHRDASGPLRPGIVP